MHIFAFLYYESVGPAQNERWFCWHLLQRRLRRYHLILLASCNTSGACTNARVTPPSKDNPHSMFHSTRRLHRCSISLRCIRFTILRISATNSSPHLSNHAQRRTVVMVLHSNTAQAQTPEPYEYKILPGCSKEVHALCTQPSMTADSSVHTSQISSFQWYHREWVRNQSRQIEWLASAAMRYLSRQSGPHHKCFQSRTLLISYKWKFFSA